MFEMDRDTRDSWLQKLFYARLSALGSSLNSKVTGGPLLTLILAFVWAISDAVDEVLALLLLFNPSTATGPAADQALAFFERPRLLAVESEQVFTILRADAASPLVVSDGATIQCAMLQSGKTFTYTVQPGEGVTIPAGTFYAKVVFKSAEKGLATALIAPQSMDQISGFSATCFVVAGAWDDSSSNPLSTMTDTFDAWLTTNLTHFGMSFRVQGRDDESDDAWRARCFARWDELSTGSTAAAYESWARSYVDPASGNAPVALAKVTQNQVFHSASCYDPVLQPLIDGQEYIMGVEVAVAFQEGAIPAPADLTAIADYLLPQIPQTDKVWVRGPNQVVAGAGTCVLTVRGSSALQSDIHDLVASFFVYDATRPANYQGLGATIYQSEVIQAVKNLSAEILDVKVAFTLAGKVVSGDIVLDPFDQIQMASPDTAIVVTVV